MSRILKESGIQSIVVALVAIIVWMIPAPMPPNARFALGVLLFLLVAGIRSIVRWLRSKKQDDPKTKQQTPKPQP